jgi:hypothetical protein
MAKKDFAIHSFELNPFHYQLRSILLYYIFHPSCTLYRTEPTLTLARQKYYIRMRERERESLKHTHCAQLFTFIHLWVDQWLFCNSGLFCSCDESVLSREELLRVEAERQYYYKTTTYYFTTTMTTFTTTTTTHTAPPMLNKILFYYFTLHSSL